MKGWKTLFITAVLVAFAGYVQAAEIQLRNGDKISGDILSDTDESITLVTEALGTVTIDKKYVKVPEPEPVVEEASPWKRAVSLGYSQTGGNTEKSEGSFTITADRSTDENDWNFKGDAYYSSSDKRMDAKKFYGMGRYAFNFGKDNKWNNFYKLEGSQDRFANVDYRITPSVGIGHKFHDEDDLKLMVEAALGYEHTNYHDDTKSTNEAVLIPRGYFEKALFDSSRISQEIVLYPSLSEIGDYRLYSETALSTALTETMAVKVSFIDEYDSSPGGTSQKNDYRLISALEYTF